MRRLQRYITLLGLTLCCTIAAFSENLTVTITPVRQVLPPQVMYYLSNPGQYFNISAQNTENEAVLMYFGVELRQLTPSSDIEIIVPGKTEVTPKSWTGY